MTARGRSAVPVAIGVLLVGIFALDLFFPLGVAAGVPYVSVALLALWLESRRIRLGVVLLACVLTVTGFFLPIPPRGETFWIGLENRVIALFAIGVTAYLGHLLLKRSSEVREREARLRAVLESAPDAILTVDRNGFVESCNPAAGAMFGRRCESLVEMPIDRLLPEFPGDVKASSRCRALTGRRLDGSEFPAEVSLGRFPRDAELRSIDYAVIVRDVTLLRDAQQRTLRSERLAAVGETLAVLSHEARNELLALRMGLTVLAESADRLDADSADLIDELQTSQRRLSRLFEDVRQHAGPIRLNPTPCRLSDVWRRAWKACDRSDRGAELVEFPLPGGEPPTCTADVFRLEQVFRNLFENALAACPDPVRIEVRTEPYGSPDDPALRICVQDNGPGLSPEARRKAFEPFFTTKSDGTGLGLAICSRILEAHGGELTLLESGGQGACFELLLPRSGASRSGVLRELAEA
ncbi:Adaptive-response sensory-kinase SasA [Planctomycetes bacterium LzC2]|uniref:histidine kinase n=2 Tax=Alienimonas chondri TaxID=2681879 RepID=A0ABX1VBU0_9PLAN|nr:Adaptive-response sensory-kinase SasA [Alienimonas chondri]